MALMETEDIMKILPHRYPMLLIDRVIESDFDKRMVGIKNLTANEQIFQGHFPGHPVMPGVLQLEAMAQLAGVLVGKKLAQEGRIAYFMAIDNARFRRLLRPGDQMRIEVVLEKIKLAIIKIKGKIFVDDEVACEADLMFTYK